MQPQTTTQPRTVAITISEKATIRVTIGLLVLLVGGVYGAGWELRGYAEEIKKNSAALEQNTLAVNAQISQLTVTQNRDDQRLRLLEDAVLVLTTESNARRSALNER